MANKAKFEMGQEIFLSLEGGITKHRVKGYFEVEGKLLYLTISFGKSISMAEETIFIKLEDAKQHAIENNNEKIKELNVGINNIMNSKSEEIIIVPEVAPVPKGQLVKKEEVSPKK